MSDWHRLYDPATDAYDATKDGPEVKIIRAERQNRINEKLEVVFTLPQVLMTAAFVAAMAFLSGIVVAAILGGN